MVAYSYSHAMFNDMLHQHRHDELLKMYSMQKHWGYKLTGSYIKDKRNRVTKLEPFELNKLTTNSSFSGADIITMPNFVLQE